MKSNSLFSHRSQEPESGVLYMVGTPIVNLNYISYRAINILKNVSFIACEDTRQTKKIMNKFQISNKLISFNKHNAKNKIPRIIENLKSGKPVAIVSDAGMPSICDPGEDIVNAAKYSKEADLSLVTFTGFGKDNKLKQIGDINLWVDTKAYNIIEMTHHIWILSIVDLIIGDAEYSA